MTRNDAQKHLELIKAFAAGKTIQLCCDGIEWHDRAEPDFDSGCVYRIKPEPRWRPWKPEEVPVGALLRAKNATHSDLLTITGRSSNNKKTVAYFGSWTLLGYDNMTNFIDLYECSLDNGKTWQPCGILE